MAKAGGRPVLLIGGSGRVGRVMLPRLAHCADLHLQYRRTPLPGNLPKMRWDVMSADDPLIAWQSAVDGSPALIVLAGVTPAPGADFSLNRAITGAVLAAAARAGIGRVLLASSSAVYGRSGMAAMSEDHPPAPLSPYGAAKLEMEAEAAIWRAQGVEICCLRIGNVAGADALLLNAGAAQIGIDRFADGLGPIRSYIGPGLLAQVLMALARFDGPLPETVNIGTPLPVGMADLATAAGLPWRWQDAAATAVQRVILDCGRLSRLVPMPAGASTAQSIIADWRGSA